MGGNSVLLEVFARVLSPEPDVGIGGEMEYHVPPGKCPSQGRQVKEIAFHKIERRILEGPSKEPSLSR